VEQLSPLLRLAVALDRRQIGAVKQITCKPVLASNEFHLLLQTNQIGDDCALELWSLNYKKNCFEEEFKLKLIPILE
jgi:exopolyphosphatase/guanosine-5'-triphosphate,3'-diphosphate pyrophosphatase